MYNADITKYSSIKLDYLFCIIGISSIVTELNRYLRSFELCLYLLTTLDDLESKAKNEDCLN